MIYKSYDQQFSEILTSYSSADPNADTSKGSDLYIRGAGLASCIWGIRKHIDWAVKQMFPSTADSDNLLQYGSDLGLDKRDGESWEQYLSRILDIHQNVSGGGNKSDVERWAMECVLNVGGVEERLDSAKAYPAKYGPGTCVVLVAKTTGDPSQALMDLVRETVLENGPICPAEVYVVKGTTKPVSISILMVGGNREQAAANISSWLANVEPGQALDPIVLKGLCLQAQATSVTVIAPATIQTPGLFERIVLAGSITWI